MKNKNLLIIIPARAGSKRVKNKNMRLLDGKPLLFYKIKSCLKVKKATVLVSTESKKIAKFSKKCGAFVPFLRSKKYSTSRASTSSVVLETIRKLIMLDYKIPEYIAILPATNPFLRTTSIIQAFQKIKKKNTFNSIIGYTESIEHPFTLIDFKNKIKFDLIKLKGKKYSQFERTQDWPKVFVGSAAIKITKLNYFLNRIKNKSPLLQMKSFDMNSCTGIKLNILENFDINNSQDFDLAEFLAKKNKLSNI